MQAAEDEDHDQPGHQPPLDASGEGEGDQGNEERDPDQPAPEPMRPFQPEQALESGEPHALVQKVVLRNGLVEREQLAPARLIERRQRAGQRRPFHDGQPGAGQSRHPAQNHHDQDHGADDEQPDRDETPAGPALGAAPRQGRVVGGVERHGGSYRRARREAQPGLRGRNSLRGRKFADTISPQPTSRDTRSFARKERSWESPLGIGQVASGVQPRLATWLIVSSHFIWGAISMRDSGWLRQFRERVGCDQAGANILQHGTHVTAPLTPRELPRTVWIFWAQGWHNAPSQSQLCLDSWIRENPDWTIRALDDESIQSYVDLGGLLCGKHVELAARSDILRLDLLARYGGVWVDASTYCSRALSEWLLLLMQSGFFAFAKPGPDRLLSTWLLAAEPGHHIVKTWRDLTIKYWQNVEKADFYYWAHYLFAEGCRTNSLMETLWHQTPWISADGPHQVQTRADEAGADDIRRSLLERPVPVHKLQNRRPTLPERGSSTPLAWLLYGNETHITRRE